MKALLATLAVGIGLGAVAQAEPLNSKQVAADAKWLVHIDVDAIKTGKVPQTIGTLWLRLPSTAENLEKISKAIGMNPTEDLHSITVYGWHYKQPGGVVIVRARVDEYRLTAFLQRKPGYRTEPYGDHKLMFWTENKGRKDEHTVSGCFHQATLTVFGRDAAEVKKALDVQDGSSPGLAGSGLLMAAEAPVGTMVEARALDLADVKLPFKSPLVRKSRVLALALGEHNGEAFALARLVTESAEVAKQVGAVVEGLLAMALLQFDSDKQMTAILEAVSVSTDEKTVKVECRGPADEAAKLVEQAWARQLKRNQPE